MRGNVSTRVLICTLLELTAVGCLAALAAIAYLPAVFGVVALTCIGISWRLSR